MSSLEGHHVYPVHKDAQVDFLQTFRESSRGVDFNEPTMIHCDPDDTLQIYYECVKHYSLEKLLESCEPEIFKFNHIPIEKHAEVKVIEGSRLILFLQSLGPSVSAVFASRSHALAELTR